MSHPTALPLLGALLLALPTLAQHPTPERDGWWERADLPDLHDATFYATPAGDAWGFSLANGHFLDQDLHLGPRPPRLQATNLPTFVLAWLGQPHPDPLPQHLGPRAHAHVFARALETQHHPSLARRLRAWAAHLDPPLDLAALDAHVHDEVATLFLERTLEGFLDLDTPRQRLTHAIHRYLERFPHAPRAEWVADLHTHLRAMRSTPRPPSRGDLAEWIYLLRDQTGRPDPLDGRCDIFAEPLDPSPTRELRDAGLDAVPSLLAALDNPHPSSCLERLGPQGPLGVLSQGEVARRVLEAIAGEPLPSPQHAHDWWSRVQTHGHTAVLVASIRRLPPHTHTSLTRLAELDPALADRTITPLFDDLPPSTQSPTLLTLHTWPDPHGLDLLQHQLCRAPWHLRRLAATTLLLRDHPDALRTLLQAWSDASPPPEPAADFARFLLSHDSPDAVRLCAEWTRSLPIGLRAEVLPLFATLHQPSPATRDAAEDALAHSLDDTPPRTRISTLSCGDLAAVALARGWPSRYAFDTHTSPFERTLQRRRCLNTHRLHRQLPLLPPDPRDPPQPQPTILLQLDPHSLPPPPWFVDSLARTLHQPLTARHLLDLLLAPSRYDRPLPLRVTAFTRGNRWYLSLKIERAPSSSPLDWSLSFTQQHHPLDTLRRARPDDPDLAQLELDLDAWLQRPQGNLHARLGVLP